MVYRGPFVLYGTLAGFSVRTDYISTRATELRSSPENSFITPVFIDLMLMQLFPCGSARTAGTTAGGGVVPNNHRPPFFDS